MNKKLIIIFIWFMLIMTYNEYLITGYANGILSLTVIRPMDVIAVDGNNNPINITMQVYYPNTGTAYGIYNVTGNRSIFIGQNTYDLEAYTSDRKLRVLFKGSVLTDLNNISIGLDSLNAGIGEVITYAISKDFEINNATLFLSYNNTDYINESNLMVLKCAEWNFLRRTCNTTFTEINVTRNTTEKRFIVDVTSLSAFAIKDTTIVSEGKPEERFGGGWISPIPAELPSKPIKIPKIPEIKPPYLPKIDIFLEYPAIRIGLSLLLVYFFIFIVVYLLSTAIEKIFFRREAL